MTQEAAEDLILLILPHIPSEYKPKMSLYLLRKHFNTYFNEPKPKAHCVCSCCAQFCSSNNQRCGNIACIENNAHVIQFYEFNTRRRLQGLFSGILAFIHKFFNNFSVLKLSCFVHFGLLYQALLAFGLLWSKFKSVLSWELVLGP